MERNRHSKPGEGEVSQRWRSLLRLKTKTCYLQNHCSHGNVRDEHAETERGSQKCTLREREADRLRVVWVDVFLRLDLRKYISQ